MLDGETFVVAHSRAEVLRRVGAEAVPQMAVLTLGEYTRLGESASLGGSVWPQWISFDLPQSGWGRLVLDGNLISTVAEE